MQQSFRKLAVATTLAMTASVFAPGPAVAQDPGASKSVVKPLFVAKKDTFFTWSELRDKYGWNGRPAMPMMTFRSDTVTAGVDSKSELYVTKGRIDLDNLEIDGQIGQGPKGVLLKQGTKILGRR